jgi:hypothetical protein
MSPRSRYLIGISLTLLAPAALADLPAGADAYKCAVDTVDGETKVIYFDAPAPAPARFTDMATAARARMPEVTQATIARIIECVRMDVGFSDRQNAALERGVPR